MCPTFRDPQDTRSTPLQQISSMKPNQVCPTQSLKSTPSETIGAAAAVVVVEDVGVEEIEVVTEDRPTTPTTLQHLRLPVAQDIEVPNILIFQLVTGQDAPCIINMGRVLFSAQNLQHALGRMFTPQDQTNEGPTSLVNR